MSDQTAPTATAPPPPTSDGDNSLRPVLAAATIVAVAGAAIAEAEVSRKSAPSPSPAPPGAATNRPRAQRAVRARRPPLRKGSVRRVSQGRPSAPVPFSETAPAAASEAPAPADQIDTQAELRNWIKDNATLLSNASLLISIAALAISFLPSAGWLSPYIQALIFGAAFLLLIELHHQWPKDLQIHAIRSIDLPDNHSWRMTGFAFLLQLATILFAVWAVLSNPLILFPLTAVAVVLVFRHYYFKRFGGRFAMGFGIISLIFVLLFSEILMLIAWSAVTGEKVTIELWTDERYDLEPAFKLET